MADFSVSVAEWAEKAKKNLDRFALEFCQDIRDEVKRSTPVDTGNLLNHWYESLDAPIAPAVGGVVQTPVTTVAGHIYYLMNGAAYARRIEYGFVGEDSLGRTYNQKPRAMVRNTIAKADVLAQAVIARLQK